MEIIVQLLKAVLFGIVEGVTEWLPVSSTGHLILLQNYIALDVSEDFFSLFEIVIQLGAILAVVILFWNKLWFIKKDESDQTFIIQLSTLKLWINIFIACLPAAIIGILFDDVIDEYFYKPIPVAVSLIVVGLLFLVTESYLSNRFLPEITSVYKIPFVDGLIIGIYQLLAAVFPGTSRSGATIIGGLILGLSRKAATEFTFFLAVPVMFGASLLKSVKFMMKGVSLTGLEFLILLFGTLIAFFVSVFVIKFLMNLIKKHSFMVFGYYRILLGILIILLEVIDFS